jgi:hypothetical protein
MKSFPNLLRCRTYQVYSRYCIHEVRSPKKLMYSVEETNAKNISQIFGFNVFLLYFDIPPYSSNLLQPFLSHPMSDKPLSKQPQTHPFVSSVIVSHSCHPHSISVLKRVEDKRTVEIDGKSNNQENGRNDV